MCPIYKKTGVIKELLRKKWKMEQSLVVYMNIVKNQID